MLVGSLFKNKFHLSSRETFGEVELPAENHPFIEGHFISTLRNLIEGSIDTPHIALLTKFVIEVSKVLVFVERRKTNRDAAVFHGLADLRELRFCFSFSFLAGLRLQC